MVNKYDIYEFIKFPNEEIREKALEQYFDTTKLQYSLEKYNQNRNQTIEIKKSGFMAFINFDEEVNEDFREKIRRINNQLFSCNVVVLCLFNYYEQLHRDEVVQDEDLFDIMNVLYRRECVKLSFEIFNIIEKIKTVIRILYNFDFKKTKFDKGFFAQLEEESESSPELKDVIVGLNKLKESKSIEEVRKLRNAEVHNEPIIDQMTFFMKCADGSRAFLVKPVYVIKNETLYTDLKQSLENILEVKQVVQTIIDTKKD